MAKKKVKKAVKKAKLKAKKPKRLPLINLKISSRDRKLVLANAKKYAGGNYSAWLRHAGIHYRPKKGEKVL